MVILKMTHIAPYLLLAAAVPASIGMPHNASVLEVRNNTATDPSVFSTQECNCYHNGDPGRWDDSYNPAGRIGNLCSQGGGCWQALAGRMCVLGNTNQCDCASQAAQAWQSWSSDCKLTPCALLND